MRRLRGSVRTIGILAGFAVPLGVIAHLAAELTALGPGADTSLAFSGRHVYLGALALVAALGFALALRPVAGGRGRPSVADLVDRLPFGGRGIRFFGLSFALQFAFFAITETLEQTPIDAGDATRGIVVAAVTSAIGALFVLFGQRRVIEAASAIIWGTPYARRGHARRLRDMRGDRVRTPRRGGAFAFRYRPPPLSA